MKKIALTMVAGLMALNIEAGEVKFKVTNMHCANCQKRVEKTLKAVETVSDVKVNLEKKIVRVEFDETKTSANALLQVLKDAKYEAEITTGCGGCKHEGNESEHKGECQKDGEKSDCKHDEKK